MIFNISEFRSVINSYNGYQRPNKFRVQFNVPPGLLAQQAAFNGSMALDTIRYMEFFCESTDLPGINLLTRTINRYGYGVSEKKPNTPIFQDVMMVFDNDSESVNLQFFQAWFGLITQFNMSQGITQNILSNNIATAPWELAYKGDYAIDPVITMYDTAGNAQYSITLRQMFPINMPHVKLAWENNQNVMKIPILFSYYDWFVNNPNPDFLAIGPSIGQTIGLPVSTGPATGIPVPDFIDT